MKAFSVVGYSQSGKTTTIENIIKELKKRRFTVGTVKEIHSGAFQIDQEGTNTYRHKKAGSEIVTARGIHETGILFPRKLSPEEILRFYDQGFVVLEGVRDGYFPKIITAHDEDEIEKNLDHMVFAISGRISSSLKEYKGIPVINGVENIDELVNLIEEKVYKKLPNVSPKCCGACGYTCERLGAKILRGEAKREDCIISDSKIKVYIDDREIAMVPFVQNTLYNMVTGFTKELKGYKNGKKIQITIGEDHVIK